MAISRFSSRFKTRTDLMDNITPNNVVQSNVSVPHGEWKPASWLPVVWQNEKSKDYFVISSGKVVSFDSSGRVVPSGLLRRCLDVGDVDTTAIIDYDANDKAARVIDITTGEFYAGTGTTAITLRAFIKAASENGWLPGESLPTEGAGNELSELKRLAKKFISAPVGVCAYDVYAWAGDDPANLHFTNYQKQHLIQFFTDIQMKAAHVAAGTVETENAVDFTLLNKKLLNNATLKAMPRYNGLPLSADVIGLKLDKPAAAHTTRTPVVIDHGDQALRRRSEPSLISKAGDWYLDDEASILLIWEDGGDGVPGTLVSVKYYQYEGAESSFGEAGEEKFIHFVGDCKPGDFVTFDKLSNMTVRSPALTLVDVDAQDDAAANAAAILDMLQEREDFTIGRVMDIIKEPRGLLERVRTGFQGDEFDASAKMPGSATGGFSDMITLSGELQAVADQIVVVNVKI
jgi:hypothetical protein